MENTDQVQEDVAEVVDESDAAVEQAAGEAPTESNTPKEGETAAQTAKRAHNNAARSAIKGRGSKLPDDARIFTAPELTENIRTAGSAGYASMEIVRSAGSDGITVGEFKERCKGDSKLGSAAAGLLHLRWDIGHGRLWVLFADGSKEQYPFVDKKQRPEKVVEEEWEDGGKPAAAKPTKAPKAAKEPKEPKEPKEAKPAKEKKSKKTKDDASTAETGDAAASDTQPQGVVETE